MRSYDLSRRNIYFEIYKGKKHCRSDGFLYVLEDGCGSPFESTPDAVSRAPLPDLLEKKIKICGLGVKFC